MVEKAPDFITPHYIYITYRQATSEKYPKNREKPLECLEKTQNNK